MYYGAERASRYESLVALVSHGAARMAARETKEVAVVADEFPDVMDAAMVAQMLGYNVDTVRRLSRNGILPAHRLPMGRAFHFLKDELLEWIREQPVHHPIPEEQHRFR